MLTGRVTGQAKIRHVQGILASSQAQLQKDMVPGVRAALRPLKPDVQREALTLPKRGGLAALISSSVRVTTNVSSGSTIKATAVVTGKGKRQERDVAALNKGWFRHPIYGRYRRLKSGERQANPWKPQRARPGFITRPIDRTRDRIVDVAIKARDNQADRIVRG